MQKPNETFRIYTKRIANLLCERGFRIVDIEVNNKKPWLYTYLFEDSDSLRRVLAELTQGVSARDGQK